LTVSITEASDFRQSPLTMAGLACLPLSIRLVSAGRCWSVVKDIQEHTESTLNGIRGPIDYFNLGSSFEPSSELEPPSRSILLVDSAPTGTFLLAVYEEQFIQMGSAYPQVDGYNKRVSENHRKPLKYVSIQRSPPPPPAFGGIQRPPVVSTCSASRLLPPRVLLTSAASDSAESASMPLAPLRAIAHDHISVKHTWSSVYVYGDGCPRPQKRMLGREAQ
jgi:hypothetical protein